MDSTSRIYAALDDRKEDHHATMVEIEGKVSNTSISILIDLGSFRNYVSPQIVETCKLDKVKQEKPWLVQLTMSMKQKVSEKVKDCEVNLNDFLANIYLNILHLELYNILIIMDSLEQHHVMIDFLHKSILCIDSQGNQKKIQGIPKKVSIRQISSLQVEKCIRKGCKLFSVNIEDVELRARSTSRNF